MNEKGIKIFKIVVAIVSFGVTVATSWLNNKDLDAKITAKVVEEVAKQTSKVEL